VALDLNAPAVCCLQEKDRAKFGPEYGDRFCMLQLVGRHEMDKVVLQRENEQNKQMLVRARLSLHGHAPLMPLHIAVHCQELQALCSLPNPSN
jgi:hypothetical protein